MSNNQNSSASMSDATENEGLRRHNVYPQLVYQAGPTVNRAQNCVICLDDMEAHHECLTHADGQCLNAWHTECLETELQASRVRTSRARCPNCRVEFVSTSPTIAQARARYHRPRSMRNRPPHRGWIRYLNSQVQTDLPVQPHNTSFLVQGIWFPEEYHTRYLNMTAAELTTIITRHLSDQLSDEELHPLLEELTVAEEVLRGIIPQFSPLLQAHPQPRPRTRRHANRYGYDAYRARQNRGDE